jgi:hypothetical protein
MQVRPRFSWADLFYFLLAPRPRNWDCAELCVKQWGTAILAVILHGLEARATQFRTVLAILPRTGRMCFPLGIPQGSME